MKIKEVIYNTPEMTEEKLLQKINDNIKFLKKDLKSRIKELHRGEELNKAILDEYDNIQDKQSYLTKSQRNTVIGYVGLCMIEMTKDDGRTNTAGNH